MFRRFVGKIKNEAGLCARKECYNSSEIKVNYYDKLDKRVTRWICNDCYIELMKILKKKRGNN